MTEEKRPEETEGGVAVAEQPAADSATTAEEKKEDKPQKLKQEVEIKDIGPCKKHIRVSVDRGDIDGRFNEQFSKLVGDAQVKGFRPGKAPRKVIEKQFQKDVTDQVKAEVLLASLEQLAEEHDIAPLSAPNLDPLGLNIPKEGPFVYEFEVEVRPQFDLPDYKGLKLKRPVQIFTDEDVNKEETRLLSPYGTVVPKPEGNADLNDVLVADITSRDGDRVLSEMKEVPVRIDPRLAFKDGVAENFAEQVKGANGGDVRVVDVKLSDYVSDPTLRGKTVKVTFDVKEVKRRELPELTHEFLHTFGVHTPEQLHELVRVILDRRLEYQQRQSARTQVMEHIAVNMNWELPRDLLVRQARRAMARKTMEMRSEGLSEDEIKMRQRLMEQDVIKTTALSLKEHFVLQKIAEVEKIDVTDDDLWDEIERIADQNNESPRKVRARFEKEDLMDALAAELIERKALDVILQSAEYEEVPVGKEEGPVAMVEQQAVTGEMSDPTAEAEKAEAEKKEEAAAES